MSNVAATQFVTFYSYKGGVGRTSALVNSAVLHALQGNNVVVLDFDLEAPGIAPYVSRIDPSYSEHRSGVLEYLVDVVDGRSPPSLADRAVDLSQRLVETNGGHLWLINAGNTIDSEYTGRLEKLKWSEIFETKFGDLLLKNLKNQIAVEFGRPDFVFIDSRTGITETGGVCTRYLADKIVILTSLNEQNINGTAMIYKELHKERKECVLVAANVPIGMPNASDQLFSQRIEAFRREFGRTPDLIIYHYPLLSLSEEVPALFLSKELSDFDNKTISLLHTDPLLESYKKLAAVVEAPVKGQISFAGLLAGSANELTYYLPPMDITRQLTLLKEYYPDRYLAQVVLKAFEFLKDAMANANRPHNWQTDTYLQLIETETEITNRSAKQAIEAIRNRIGRLLRNYAAKNPGMDRSLEVFVEPKTLNQLALEEISRGRYPWVIDVLNRSLSNISDDDHETKASCIFNLSQALLRSGNRDEALTHFKRFVQEFEQLDLANTAGSIRANYYLCAALAYKELGFDARAKTMYEKSAEQVSLLPQDGVVFSPFDYTIVSVQRFKNQLETSRHSGGEKRNQARWANEDLIHPARKVGASASHDLPQDVLAIVEEARSILEFSPKGAAALLRLSVQMLCKHLGEKGEDLNSDIANLVKKGLSPVVQKSLDIVRVIGNESVHPGVIDVNDDKDTAIGLLDLINIIGEQMFTQPKHVNALYQKLPKAKRDAIQKPK